MRRDADHRGVWCRSSALSGKTKACIECGRIRLVREVGPPWDRRVRNLSDGSTLVVLAEVDIAVIFDEERFGEGNRRRARGRSEPRWGRRGGYRGIVQHRQLSRLGERRALRGGGGGVRVPTDAAVDRAQAPAPGDPRRLPLWRSIGEYGMNGKPAWSPVPRFDPRTRKAAATL